MKISIKNFKSIRELNNFELKPFNIISGVNSSGKSSFIQLLLLLKQTIELESSNQPLLLNGDYYSVKNFNDIIYGHNPQNKLSISFSFNKAAFSEIEKPQITSLFNVFDDYEAFVEVKYEFKDEQVFIQEFLLNFTTPKGRKKKQFLILSRDQNNQFSIETNEALFGKELFFNKPVINNIVYSSIFPLYYEGEKKEEIEDLREDNVFNSEYDFTRGLINIEDIKIVISSFFTNISYLGPLREQPKDEYYISKKSKGVGIKGQFVARVLENNSSTMVESLKIKKDKEGLISYKITKEPLLDGVKYWICDVFNIAKDIFSEKKEDTYQIFLVGHSGLKTTIKHVGFGISQILPIVVEGLRMSKKGTLILEQPEIHLHPKLQSLLYDFLYGLTLQGKTIIVETHSNHFITRMRRRIAEDDSNEMDDKINLTFIESQNGKHLFRTLNLDDYGVLEYFPDDFIEQSNSELKAIVKAQMKKRKNA